MSGHARGASRPARHTGRGGPRRVPGTVVELPVEEVPEPEPGDLPDGWRRWLAGRGVGLVPTDILTEGTIAVGDHVDAIDDPAS